MAPNEKDTLKCVSFSVGAIGSLQCSAEVNSACAKVFAQAKTLVRRTSAARLFGTLYL